MQKQLFGPKLAGFLARGAPQKLWDPSMLQSTNTGQAESYALFKQTSMLLNDYLTDNKCSHSACHPSKVFTNLYMQRFLQQLKLLTSN